MSRRTLGFLVALYPKTWRRRYAEELADLCDEYIHAGEGTRARLALNIACSAFAQHLRSLLSGPRRVAGVVAMAFLLVAMGAPVLTQTGLSVPALSPLVARAVNAQGSSNHIGPAPTGAKATVSSETAIATSLKGARGATVLGIGLANFASRYPRRGVLCWVVAINRPGPHLSWGGPLFVPQLHHGVNRPGHDLEGKPVVRATPQYNYDVMFIDASDGALLEETQGYSPLFPGHSSTSVR